MITLDSFIQKWTGKGIDFDNSYGFQCVDLYRQYVKEVLGIPQTPGVAGAKDIWNSCPGFEKILNSPDAIPLKGDVMIWGSKYGPYGHVAVVTEADINKFTCFSQNDPSGSLPGLKTYKAWSTLLGWLRAKEVITSDNTQRIAELEKEVAEKNLQIKGYDEQVTGLVKKIDEITAQLKEANASSDGFRKQHNEFVASLATKLGTRQETVEILASVDTCLEFEDKAGQLDRTLELERKEHEYAVNALEKKIATLESNLEALKADFKALKDTTTTPIQPTPKYSILDIIKKMLGI